MISHASYVHLCNENLDSQVSMDPLLMRKMANEPKLKRLGSRWNWSTYGANWCCPDVMHHNPGRSWKNVVFFIFWLPQESKVHCRSMGLLLARWYPTCTILHSDCLCVCFFNRPLHIWFNASRLLGWKVPIGWTPTMGRVAAWINDFVMSCAPDACQPVAGSINLNPNGPTQQVPRKTTSQQLLIFGKWHSSLWP